MSKSKKITEITGTEDFRQYLNTVVRIMKSDKERFPAINEVVGYIDFENMDAFCLSIVIVCVYAFDQNQTTIETAKEIEKCAQDGKDRAMLLCATEGSTVH